MLLSGRGSDLKGVGKALQNRGWPRLGIGSVTPVECYVSAVWELSSLDGKKQKIETCLRLKRLPSWDIQTEITFNKPK